MMKSMNKMNKQIILIYHLFQNKILSMSWIKRQMKYFPHHYMISFLQLQFIMNKYQKN